MSNIKECMNYELSDADFEKIRNLIYEQSGICLGDGKKELVKARLGKRLRAGDFSSFTDYLNYVTKKGGTEELILMVDSISTNLTYFFREEKHFLKVRNLIETSVQSSRKPLNIKIWSAGCSTGEEPYSLAVIVKEAAGQHPFSLSILATDISTKVLAIAAEGIYHQEKMKNISEMYLKKYFQYGSGKWEGYYRVKSEIRELVQFMRWNLLELLPATTMFDVIFCRNVMIYFDKETQDILVKRFYEHLKEGGYLFIGHSESLAGMKNNFKYLEPSVYRK